MQGRVWSVRRHWQGEGAHAGVGEREVAVVADGAQRSVVPLGAGRIRSLHPAQRERTGVASDSGPHRNACTNEAKQVAACSIGLAAPQMLHSALLYRCGHSRQLPQPRATEPHRTCGCACFPTQHCPQDIDWFANFSYLPSRSPSQARLRMHWYTCDDSFEERQKRGSTFRFRPPGHCAPAM